MFNPLHLFHILLRLAQKGAWRLTLLIWLGVALSIAVAVHFHWFFATTSLFLLTSLGIYWNHRAHQSPGF